MCQIDNDVSDIIRHLISQQYEQPTRIGFDLHDASCLSRFILSLMFRDPVSINEFKSAIAALNNDISSTLRAEAERRGYDNERFLPSYASFLDAMLGEQQFQMYSGMIDNPLRGGMLDQMMWFVRELDECAPRLFTSDRPVVLSDVGFDDPQSYVALPLSPNKALIAFKKI